MRFKTINQKYRWQISGNRKLRNLLDILDDFTQMFFDKEIVITSTIRKRVEGKLSYHPLGQAVDIRTKDVEDIIVTGWIVMIAAINAQGNNYNFEGKFTWLHENKGEANEHFHLQLRKGKPV